MPLNVAVPLESLSVPNTICAVGSGELCEHVAVVPQDWAVGLSSAVRFTTGVLLVIWRGAVPCATVDATGTEKVLADDVNCSSQLPLGRLPM